MSPEGTSQFVYKNNPLDNPKATKDILKNDDAVYGFVPDTNSDRIGDYANKIDWTDPEQVATARARREAYHQKNENIYKEIEELRNQGASSQEIATEASRMRNQNRLDDYSDDPEGLEILKNSNMREYNNPNGPTPESLYEKYGSWDVVLEKTLSTNSGMDACCGLYDKYYYLYNID